jgi:hypothetical protein
MKIKSASFLMFLSLYTMQSYGMENNAAEIKRRTLKHTENSQTRRLNKIDITATCQLATQHKSRCLSSTAKSHLQISLQEKTVALGECYSAEETWSGDDLAAYQDGKELIELLVKKQNQ